jgi:hypothetical protein
MGDPIPEVNLSNNPLGADGASSLAAAPNLTNVFRLSLEGCGLGEECEALLRQRYGPVLLLE